MDPQDQGEEDGANIDLDAQRKGKCAVIKTSTRQTYFLPVIGLVDAEKLSPGDLVVSSVCLDGMNGVNLSLFGLSEEKR